MESPCIDQTLGIKQNILTANRELFLDQADCNNVLNAFASAIERVHILIRPILHKKTGEQLHFTGIVIIKTDD